MNVPQILKKVGEVNNKSKIIMEKCNFGLIEMSQSEMRSVNGGVSRVWYLLGCWCRARYESMLEDIEDGIYID